MRVLPLIYGTPHVIPPRTRDLVYIDMVNDVIDYHSAKINWGFNGMNDFINLLRLI